MKEVSHYLVENKNMVWSVSMCLLAMLLIVFILNTTLGLFVHFFDPAQSIFWHSLSLYFVVLLVGIVIVSCLFEFYIFRHGGHSLAWQLKGRRLELLESTPEESLALRLASDLAERFQIETPVLYVLPDEVGVNALTAGFSKQNVVIILTWGALQNLDELELYGLLGHEFNQILSGEAIENTKLKILYSGLISFSQLGSRVAKQGFKAFSKNKYRKFETSYVALGGIIWLLGSIAVLIVRLIKYLTLSRRTFRNDLKTTQLLQNNASLQTLLRIYVHHAGSQIHSVFSESIAHMCFANSLSAQSWLNIHPTIEDRIFELNPTILQDLQLENLKKIKSRPFLNLFRILEDAYGRYIHTPWASPQPLPLLRLLPISFALNDAIMPLNPDIRRSLARPELIQRALQTATGSREVIVAIFMIRQYREFIPSDVMVSRSIVDALLMIDSRVYVQIFKEACHNISAMPATMARQFLTRLASIIQADGQIGLLDALLLEKVKDELNLMPVHMPTSLDDVKLQIVRLVDALLHVQQNNNPNQLEVRDQILTNILGPSEMIFYQEISEEPIDFSEVLNDVAGLLLRDRLMILGMAELCLWNDRIITQDELDVLELLYWRFGFSTEGIVNQMQKKNSLLFI